MTIVYVNGILTSKEEADKDVFSLTKQFEKRSSLTDVSIINGYNPSHLGGGGDLYKSIQQALQRPTAVVVQDYDLKTILMQIQPQVTTRKILLVGHSQGTFYTNAMLRYLLEVGVPEGSVAIYNLASPAAYVDGVGSMYLTSANDKLIRRVRDWAGGVGARAPLPDNIRIPFPAGEETEEYGGHHFASSYLNQEPDRIIGDISKVLATLKAGRSPATDGCFAPPTPTLTYKAEQLAFKVADPTVGPALSVATPVVKALAAATQKAYAAASSAAAALANAFSNFLNLSQSKVSAASQGAAAASALTQSSTPPTPQTPKPVSPKPSNAAKPIATISPLIPPTPTPPPEIPPPVTPDPPPPVVSPEPTPTPPATTPPDTSAPPIVQSVGGTPSQNQLTPVVIVPLAVSSPADGALYATSSVTFTGTTTAGFVVALTYGPLSASATADASGDWSATLEFPDGTTVVGIVAADAGGNTSDAATRTVTVSTAPVLEAPTASIDGCPVPAGEYCELPGLIVYLQWNAIADATGYSIIKSSVIDSTTDTRMEFLLENNATTTFAIAATYASGGTATSTEVSVFTFLPDPPPGFSM
ncbi:hypothetical protein A3D71_03975 [Candidatus Kaiserbacteria bacterium RIFCSPHIGHO2_02_FULL_55_20]|uniref:Bacterial Ig-like domain-containing protein n=1 Tax=Candidatus Kaiserbacteria bacterium RIFCSPHIGHO2_02_FULL_55_20 TaxID=1798497 RepID=A0A1F6DXY2_9BACT|nr:MAG: hypothetical protein A3D71_03975 [Candidatus Kaiserbacteria bacterium RIFCSPHIGHO2_02_FULL_55_20]